MKKLKKLVAYLAEQKVTLYAANASFFLILSIFPTLVVLLALMRYTGLQVEAFTDLVGKVVPGSLMPMVNKLVLSAYVNSTGTVLSVSAVAALWSASRGMYSFVTGLNAIYQVKENRGYFRTRLICMGYTFAFLLVLLLTLVLQVFGTTLTALMPVKEVPVLGLLAKVVNNRFFVLLAVQSLIFALMFTFLPNGRNRFRDTIPGALLASLGWLLFSDAYSIYVERFAGLSNIYGSVYAVALSMLWLYCCMSILFYAGALNQYLEDHR